MSQKLPRALLCLSFAALLLLAACAPGADTPDASEGSGALTWPVWNGYDNFFELLHEACPDIALDFTAYTGANQTGYSWARMRADDITDVFITSQILDEALAEERLVDLSGYDFINNFSTSVLDQVSIDGGIYLLPVNYAMYGILYNKTLMEEHNWALPTNFAELEALCGEIRAAGLIPGVLGTQLTGNAFSAVFNLAKTSWLTTPEGMSWERDFLAGRARAEGMWEGTMDYVQRYIDTGMFTTDPENRSNPNIVLDYLGNRKAVFCTVVLTVNITELPDTGDKLGMMPFISEDGSKNIYMYSPSSYIGISRRLAQPGNEKKLESAVRLLSLLYSPEGQQVFLTEETPCVLGIRNSGPVGEDSLIYDAQQAMWEGRAFPMTYVRWENVLSDIGQAYTDWFRGENGMDGPKCIARMDELQTGYLNSTGAVNFCTATSDFTLEETAALVGKVLGSAAGADAAVIPVSKPRKDSFGLKGGITGKLYEGSINAEISNTIAPGYDGEYAVLTMTGAQVKELVQAGFDAAGDGDPFPYVLVVRGGGELEDGAVYRVAFLMNSYTEQTGQAYGVQVIQGSIRAFLRDWLTAQKTVSPDGNPWN